MRKYYISLMANLFFLFFTSPILSPSFSGNKYNGDAGLTIYLFWIIPLLDIYYLDYLYRSLKKNISFYLFVGIVFITGLFLINNRLVELAKIYSIAFSLSYITYTRKNLIFYLYRWINVNIFIGIAQFISFYYHPFVSEILSPHNIANWIWGTYATASFSNFKGAFSEFDLDFMARVSGLSREGGFFASLIIMSIIFLYYEKNTWKNREFIILIIGALISFSKVTILFIPLVFILYFKKYIDKINFWILFISFSFVMFNIGYFILDYFFFSETFMHRFAGYVAVNYMSFDNILTGIQKSTILNPDLFDDLPTMLYFPYRFNSFAGYPSIILSIGYIGLSFCLFVLYKCRLSSSGLLFLLTSTITVTPITATSFSCMVWWIITYHYRSRIKTVYDKSRVGS